MQVMQMLMEGNKERTQEPTAANKTSSRSHAILQVSESGIHNLCAMRLIRQPTEEEKVYAFMFFVDVTNTKVEKSLLLLPYQHLCSAPCLF